MCLHSVSTDGALEEIHIFVNTDGVVIRIDVFTDGAFEESAQHLGTSCIRLKSPSSSISVSHTTSGQNEDRSKQSAPIYTYLHTHTHTQYSADDRSKQSASS